MTEEVNHYAYWQNSQDGETTPDQDIPLSCGFYRLQGAKTKYDAAVAIWRDGESLYLQIGRRKHNEKSPEAIEFEGIGWLKCLSVPYDEYLSVVGNSNQEGTWRWPDGKPANKTVAEQDKGLANASQANKKPEEAPSPVDVANRPSGLPAETGEEVEPGIGHNQGPPLGEELASKVKAESELLLSLTTKLVDEQRTEVPITDQETADKVAEIKERLAALHKKHDAERLALRKPFLDEAEKIQKAYVPALEAATETRKRADAAVKKYLKDKKAEEERKAREAAAAEQAEREREAREKAELAGDDPEKAAANVEQVQAKKVTVRAGGGTGRATTSNVRVTWKAEITDQAKLLEFLKDNAELKSFLQDWGSRFVRNDKGRTEIPGVRAYQE